MNLRFPLTRNRWGGVHPDAFNPEELDISVILGVLLSVGLVAVVALAGEGSRNFFNPLGLLIVLGGTAGAALVHFSSRDLAQAWTAFRGVWFERDFHPADRISELVGLSQAVRRDGLLQLDSAANRCRDSFFRMALQVAVDGRSEHDLRRILETEMRASYDRATRAIQVFETMGTYAPAMGLIGTLIGLIQMLGNLSDPSTVGPAMAVALVTTLYGAISANFVFLPTAGKLRNRIDEESLVKAITLEGVLSLSREENPIMLEQRLQSFLPLVANG